MAPDSRIIFKRFALVLVVQITAIIKLFMMDNWSIWLIALMVISFAFWSVGAWLLLPEYRIAQVPGFFGGLLNFVAIGFNGWQMPVINCGPGYHCIGIHKAIDASTRLYWLCDVYFQAFSLGDLLMFCGIPMLGIMMVIRYFEQRGSK